MARAIWSGSISFGMVSIPVKLFGATESKDISFNLLHATCGTRLQQRRWCPTDEVDVPWNETARGYEYAKGQYVMLTDEDFERLPLPSKHTIELTSFVEEKEIDPVFYERSYYLEPARAGRETLRAIAEGVGKAEPHRHRHDHHPEEGATLRAPSPRWHDHAGDAFLSRRDPGGAGHGSR